MKECIHPDFFGPDFPGFHHVGVIRTFGHVNYLKTYKIHYCWSQIEHGKRKVTPVMNLKTAVSVCQPNETFHYLYNMSLIQLKLSHNLTYSGSAGVFYLHQGMSLDSCQLISAGILHFSQHSASLP